MKFFNKRKSTRERLDDIESRLLKIEALLYPDRFGFVHVVHSQWDKSRFNDINGRINSILNYFGLECNEIPSVFAVKKKEEEKK